MLRISPVWARGSRVAEYVALGDVLGVLRFHFVSMILKMQIITVQIAVDSFIADQC